MSPALETFEQLILDRGFHHGGAVLRNAVASLRIKPTPPSGGNRQQNRPGALIHSSPRLWPPARDRD
jgi:hypothetical protein